MKTIKLAILFLALPLSFYAQSLTGLWTGTLSNDSSTIRKDQALEIVLTHYKDKVYGYSRMTFIVHDTLYYIVKRVKGTVVDDLCEVVDDEIVSHNFPRKPDKGVKLVSTFRRNKQDSTWHLDGDWKTTETKKHRYYSISGKLSLKTEPDLSKSKLFPHLEELKLDNDVAFYQESKKAEKQKEERQKAEQQAIAIAKKPAPTIVKQEPIKETKQPTITSGEITREEVAKNTVKPAQTLIKQPITEEKKETVAVITKKEPAVETKQVVNVPEKEKTITSASPAPAKTEPVAEVKQPFKNNKPETVFNESRPAVVVSTPVKKEDAKPIVKQEPPKTEIVEQKKPVVTETAKNEVRNAEITSTAITTPKENKPVAKTPEIKPIAASNAATAVAERKLAVPQTVLFKSDSLELSLYDNGEIDGDTVSILLNGELILAKQGLKASAIKKTIYVPAGQSDSLTLVLYAENLGKYPPNTGLLVVHDGEDTYQIRFSADLQQNAAVIFKRKRN
jgi:uncharacterized membrane protein required for colicin V production